MGVTVGGFDLEDTFFNCKEGDIESTTSKIEDEDVLLLSRLLIKTIGDSSSGWLVDNSENIDSRDGSGILGCLSLRIIEVSWDGDDSILDFFSEVSLSDFLHLDEDHRRDLFSLELFSLSFVLNDNHWLIIRSRFNLKWPKFAISLNRLLLEFSSDESLSIENGVEWVSGGLILSRVSDESLILGEGNIRWGGVKTLIVGDDFNLVIHPNSDAGVGGSKIDSNSS